MKVLHKAGHSVADRLNASWRYAPGVALCFLTFAFWGCSSSNDAKETNDANTVETTVNRAPAEIDPRILEERLFKEAPMLAERVARGELPPVAERLPENPLVVAPMNEIGRYGGEIRRTLQGEIVDETAITKTLNDSLTGYKRPIPHAIEPNLAERWQFQDGGKTALFYLRKGVKWSDGHPFTTDDVLFWYYDMAFDDNARTVALFPSIWLVDGEPAVMQKVDDYTLKVSASKPLGRVLDAFAFDDFAYPRHVYASYHPRYNPDSTYEDFQARTNQALLVLEPGIPHLSAWVSAKWTRGLRVVFERNPYYWKVDTVGNQLPYADRLVFTTIQDPQVMLLKFTNGEFDLFGRYASNQMLSGLRSEAEQGKIQLKLSDLVEAQGLFLNWDTPRRNLREAFRERRVRIALSLAINRDEISEIVYQGLMNPSGYSLSRLSPYYSEEAHMKYSQYDPARANALLEEAGFRDRDGDGFREFPGGERFELTIDATSSAAYRDLIELVAGYWEAVGIKAHTNTGLEEIIYTRRLNGEFDVYNSVINASSDPMGRPNAWAIMTTQTPWWHRNATEEGPEWLHEATRILREAMTTVDKDKLTELMIRFRDLHTENIPVIGVGEAKRVWGASSRLGNVPDKVTFQDTYRGWSRPLFHEQIYIK